MRGGNQIGRPARKASPRDTARLSPIQTSASRRLAESFEPGERRSYGWLRTYTRDEWLDQLATHSDHRTLPPKELKALLDAVGQVIDRRGGSIVMSYRTLLVTGVRRATPPE